MPPHPADDQDDRDDDPRGVAGPGEAGYDGPGSLAERRWSIVAGVCLVAAAALWLLVGVDAAFVVATFGVLAWFWDQRNRIERRSIESGGRREADDDDYVDDEDDEFEDDGEGGAGDGIDNDDAKPKDVKR